MLKPRAVRVGLCSAVLLVCISLLGLPLLAQDSPTRADAIVVIGGDHKPERMERSAALYADGYAPQILISAGTMVQESGEWLPEAQVMIRQLASHTIPADVLVIEQTSQTTRENALETLPILRAHNIHSILLVTSPYHSRRAQTIFNEIYGGAVQVNVQPALPPDFCALCWWLQPDNQPIVLSEYWKWLVWLVARR